VLFDAGMSARVWHNVESLGLAGEIADLDAVVLSHGHYDHTGGLIDLLGRRRGDLAVHVRPGIFGRKVAGGGRRHAPIGVPVTRGELERANARLVVNDDSREILPGIFVTGEIERREDWEETDAVLCLEAPDGSVGPDPFTDEQALAVRTKQGLVVYVGCAHRGLLNSIAAAREAAGEDRVRAVFGGAHLRAASEERIERTVEAVARLDPELVVLGHCTGARAELLMAERLGERFQPLRAGASWTLA
jgi:7,8-dihydropterin-6-yl-methyl-4-(beta-D-ribofuranosyl)aminobenzene 5'-phosphate synthase